MRALHPLVLVATLAIAACGSPSPIFTPGTTPPVFSAAPISTSGSALPSTEAPVTATPTPSGVSGFGTDVQAHDYAAQQGATQLRAVLVTDQSNCPSVQGAACYIESNQETVGNDAAYFKDSIYYNPTGNLDVVYLYHDSDGWHWLDSLGTQSAFPSQSASVPVQIDNGCANVRATPSLTAAIVTCLHNGAVVTIDDGPTWADGHIWWHLSDRGGWIIHESLIPGFAPQTQQ